MIPCWHGDWAGKPVFGAISSPFPHRKDPWPYCWVIVTSEREVVLGFQPAVIGAAEVLQRSEFDHGIFPWLNLGEVPGAPCARHEHLNYAPKPPSTFSTVPVTNDAAGLARNTTPGGGSLRGAVALQRVLCALGFGERAAILRIHVGIDRAGLQHVHGKCRGVRGRAPRPCCSQPIAPLVAA